MIHVPARRADMNVGRIHPYFYPVPATVVLLVVRVVAEHVLFTELFQDAKENRTNSVRRRHIENPAAALVHGLGQGVQLLPVL